MWCLLEVGEMEGEGVKGKIMIGVWDGQWNGWRLGHTKMT